MTTLSPPPIRDNIVRMPERAPRWRRLIPRTRRRKAATAGALAVLLVAGLLGATYETSPGGTLWGAEKALFSEHAQEVALSAVVTDLKTAQDILGSGQQPTSDQLTQARTSLNQAKQGLDYVSPSPQRTSLQNLYLQLTQQLLQYTPDSVQQLPALPAPLPTPSAADPNSSPQTPDVALTSASAPTWGYPITDEAGTVAPDDFTAPPPDVPDAPAADWPQPYDAPLTPNLDNLGYYDPSWGQLYGYNPTDWYNYDLGGYNQYGYDFVGFDRWGYDRWGYDRWGYDRWGYNWAGYNRAGYDRDGWDRDGRNDWGQRRDHHDDPRDRDWYNRHHPYEQYYQWRFGNDDPVYHRAQWDQNHGFHPNLYQNWNMSRDWHDPRNRDWAPLGTTSPTIQSGADIHLSSPVVNLKASLTQFISTDKATSNPGLMKDLADKSARDFTNELAPQHAISAWSQPLSTSTTNHDTFQADPHSYAAPPALAAPVPMTPPSKVSPMFTTPKIPPAPVYTPPPVAKPQDKPESTTDNTAPDGGHNAPSGPPAITPGNGALTPAAPPAEPAPAAPPAPAVASPSEHSPSQQTNPAPQSPPSESRSESATPPQQEQQAPPQQTQEVPRQHAQEAPQQRTAPEPPTPQGPAPETQARVPEAPVRQAPVHEAPAPQPPVREAPPTRQAPPIQEAPAQQAPPVREAPPVQEAPPHPAPAPPSSPKCSIPVSAC